MADVNKKPVPAGGGRHPLPLVPEGGGPGEPSVAFLGAIELLVGHPISEIRNTPIEDQRHRAEQSCGQPTRFKSRFPLIGRGNVLRDRIVDRPMVERFLDEALR